MGLPYNQLIAPAILFLNPNSTREELVKLLDETHSSWMMEYSPDQAWDYFDSQYEDKRFHKGLEGLAGILGLKTTKEFQDFNKRIQDQNGLFLNPPTIFPLPLEEGSKYNWAVLSHKKNVIESMEVVSELSWCKLEEKGIWQEVQNGIEKGLVKRIIKEEFLGSENEDEDTFEGGPKYRYEMEIYPIEEVYEEQKFETEKELHNAWPQFHPNSMYKWETTRGNFSGTEGEDKFFWMQEGERYRLDPKTFDSIPQEAYFH